MSPSASALARRATLVLATALLGGACAASAPQIGRTSHPDDPFGRRLTQIDFGFGKRIYDDPGWAPNDEPLAFTFDFQEHAHLGPFKFEAGLHFGRDRERVDVGGGVSDSFTSETAEFSIGLRKNFDVEGIPFTPYVGAGGAYLFADLETSDGVDTVRDDAHGGGGYAKIGVMISMGGRAHVALEFRQTETESLDFGDYELDGSSRQFAILFGTRF